MATYRTIRMAFWSDPYIETLSASEKLLYLYLFSCPHTNNLGLLAVSRRRMAYDTGLTEEAVNAALAAFERDDKIATDGDAVWVCHFIRHQCSTSPKILVSLRSLFPTVESAKIRKAILALYPHLLGAAPCPADRVSVGFRESEQEREKEDQIGTDGFFIPVEMLEDLQRDFPDVDVQAEITRIRKWQAEKRTPDPQRLAVPADVAFQCEGGEASRPGTEGGKARLRCRPAAPYGSLPALAGSPRRELGARPRMVQPHPEPWEGGGMIHTWTTPEPRAYATPEEAARGLERLLDDLADTRGTCVAALANLRGGLAAHDPARLVLAAEALSAVSLELSYCSGDAARMGCGLDPVRRRGGRLCTMKILTRSWPCMMTRQPWLRDCRKVP